MDALVFSTHSDFVTLIARKLKTKSSVTAPELNTLKNALIDDAVNIDVVLHTHGALRGLVREMTGTYEAKCIDNLKQLSLLIKRA